MNHYGIGLKFNLHSIEHTFLEPEHTHIECAVVHFKIDRRMPKEVRNTSLDWHNIEE